VTVPLTVVEVPLFVVVPVAVEVPPWGPVTLAESDVPVLVFFTVAVPETVVPFALVAEPVAVAVLPFSITVPDAVPPCFEVTVCCAGAEATPSVKPKVRRAMAFAKELQDAAELAFVADDW
jgi:hypothetical protein